MKATCGARPALLGTPLRKQAGATTRRQRGAASRLQVQAIKIKWNEPSEKPSSSRDEDDTKAAANAVNQPGSATAAAQTARKDATAAPNADHKQAGTKPATPSADATGQSEHSKPSAHSTAAPAPTSQQQSAATRQSQQPEQRDLAATMKEVAAKLGVIPSKSPSPPPAETDKKAADADKPSPAPAAAASNASPGADQPAAKPAAAAGASANGSKPSGAAAAAQASAAARAPAPSPAKPAADKPSPAASASGAPPTASTPAASASPSSAGYTSASSPATAAGAPLRPPPAPTTPTVMGAEAKLAVAAKISAARTLARKLAEEKQAALAASRLATARAVDPEEAKKMIQSAENEVAELAREAARADSMARAAKKAELGQAQQLELQRLKAENEMLQQLLLQLAADRAAAELKLKEVKEKYSSPADLEALKKELESGAMPTALAGLAAKQAAPAAAPAAPAAAQAAPAAAQAAPAAAQAAPQAAPPAAPAPKEAVKPAEAPKPAPPPPPPKTSADRLRELAEAALKANQKVFTLPEGAVAVGQPATIFYNRTKGPLPGNAAVALKVGYNKWESMEVIPMARAKELEGMSNADWWRVELPLPQLLFRVDYVTMDANSGAVDNNGGRDFQLALSGAISEQELQMKRMQLLEAYERQRQQELREEEDRILAEWMRAAEAAAQEARLAYHARRREQLMQEARAVVSERRGAALQHISTSQGRQGVFGWPDGVPEAGGVGVLVYNKSSGPLRGSASPVFLHVGYDGWWLKDKRVMAMTPLGDADVQKYNLPRGEWVSAEVPAWNTAAMLDYVFSDDRRAIWDNNGGTDYHTLLRNPASGDKLVQLVFEALDTATAADTAHQEELAARRVLDKAQVKATAGRKRRELQSRFLFTKPLTPVAGQPVDVFYNPDETSLRGRPDLYVTGSFNRWTHAERIRPLQMQPVVQGGVGWHKATVQVPPDAHVIDLAFLDSRDEKGGFYDNNKGLDYHIAVKGGRGVLPKLRCVHVAAEMAPIAKEGGLGDVVTALGRAVQEEGHEVEILLPKYDSINYAMVENLRMVKDYWLNGVQIKIWKGVVEDLNTTFLEPTNGYFWRGRIYTDMWSDRERFYYFCGCALEYIKHHADARQPDIVHCHDWQSAPVAWLDHGTAKSVFTIHNLNYGADLIGQAMAACDVATTVSPTYREEISGNPAVAPHYGKFFGIRNGIDPDIWDPAEDPYLPRGYTADSVAEGKAAAKAELRKRMQLSAVDVPIVGCVTRLTHQKGIHLIKHAAWRTLERGAQFVLLGSAPDPKVQAEFTELSNDLARQYPDRARLWFAYDEPLSHLIYAGCDMFLVPSVFEPCGLTQMIAMRYGTVPVVRKTGGLNDTVFDVDHDEERAAQLGMELNGFSFEGMDSAGMDYALNRALSRWYGERDWWNALAKKVMQMDWSWSSPALDYLELYYRALKRM